MRRIAQCVARTLGGRPKKLLQWQQGRLVASAMLSWHTNRERSVRCDVNFWVTPYYQCNHEVRNRFVVCRSNTGIESLY